MRESGSKRKRERERGRREREGGERYIERDRVCVWEGRRVREGRERSLGGVEFLILV
jgi:hypothetical protein